MADSLSANINAKISGTLTNTVGDTIETASIPFELAIAISLTDGTSSSKADKCWFSNNRTLTGTTPEDIDLYDFGSIDIGAGAGKAPDGGTLALVEIVAILIRNDTTSTGNIFVGGKNATTAFNSFLAVGGSASDTAQVGPIHPGGGMLIWSYADPAYAVADVSNHLLTITPTANATYDIYVLGRSA